MEIQELERTYMAAARADFAGLGDDWVWFDNAGGSFTLQETIARVAEYMRTMPVQLGGNYALSLQAGARQREATGKLAQFINARTAEEIVFGSSSTALTWQLARAMRPLLQPGDEIIITVMDHEANRSPWLWLQECGVKIRTWNVNEDTLALSLEHLDELLNPRTRLVCFSQCSNILGRIEPVAEITQRAHAVGARVFVDGVAYAPHRRIDVQQWDVDFYVCSLYKLFGPHIGMLYGKREALLELGNINHEYLAADALPYKLQPGGASYELVWGATAIVDYFEQWQQRASRDPFELIAGHESALLQLLLNFLSARADISLLGSPNANPASRLPIVAFRHATLPSKHIADALIARKLAVRHGHFHSRRLLEYLGIPPDDGVVRISLAHYNAPEEIERLIQSLQEILSG